MKHLVLSVILFSLIIVIIQPPTASDAKKIKIKLKDVKKLKKYAYLLAGQRKKFYAIPFPFPLPVFVKRQQIYTQVPIIPRYVTTPQQYSSSDSYEAESQRYPTKQASSSPSSSASSSSQPPSRHYKRQIPMAGQFPMSAYYNSLAASSGYFGQLANALSQVHPSFAGVAGGSGGNHHRDVLSKMLRGQAKVMSPVSLLTALKSPTMSAINQEYQDTMSQDQYEQRPSAVRTKDSSSSSSSASASLSSSTSSSDSTSSSSLGSGSQVSDDPKQSASEQTKSRTRLGPMGPFAAAAAAYPFDPYRFAAMQLPLPYATSLANAQMLAQMRLPTSLLAGVGGVADLLPTVAQQQQLLGVEPVSEVQQSLVEQQEVAASSPQDYETIEHHQGRQPKPLSAMEQQQQYLMALQRLRNHQQQQRSHHHEQALRLALAREQEAMRLAESRAILIRAQHLGLPMPEQLRLARYYRSQGGM